MNDFVQAFHFVFDNASFVWNKTLEHIGLSVEAILISIVIAVPIGVLLGHIHRYSFLAINTANIGRALPSLGVLAILLPVFGIGRTNVIIALVVLAVPPILTNSYVAVDGVDTDTVDAAKGIGLKPSQVLSKVELPLALPLIFAGVRTSAVFVVATATLAGFFGGGGLGDIISNPASYHLSGVIGAAYVLIVLAFVSQGLFLLLEWSLTPKSLRTGRGSLLSSQRATITAAATGELEEQDSDDEALEDLGSIQLEQGSTTR